MTILQGTLVAFAVWTLVVLVVTIGVYRWSRILTGRSGIHEFPAHAPNGAGWYQRATRAHANCVENLPVFGAIVLTASLVGARGTLMDALGVAVIGARVCQTVTHVAFVQTARAVSVRFTFFCVQLAAMFGLAVLLVAR